MGSTIYDRLVESQIVRGYEAFFADATGVTLKLISEGSGVRLFIWTAHQFLLSSQRLVDDGKLETLHGQIYVLTDMSLYSERIGLLQQGASDEASPVGS